MLARLILALLLVLGASPVASTAGPCHGGIAMTAMTMAPVSAPGRPAHDPLVADHGCIGCAALADWLGERIAPPARAPGVMPVAPPRRLALRDGGPPVLRPPRIG